MTGVEETVAIVGAVSAAVGAAAAVAQGMAQADAQKRNAEIAQQEAQANAQIQAANNRRRMGEIQAAYGGAGVTSQGTPLDVMSDQAAQGELEKRLILWRGQVGAQQDILQGNAAETAGFAKAGTTLLTAGGNFLGNQATPSGPGVSPALAGPAYNPLAGGIPT